MILFFVVMMLLIQKPENINVLVKDAATTKNMIVDGADYIHKTIDKEFSLHSDEEYKEEHGEDRHIEERLDILKKKIKKMEEPVA
jgi:hypothetical protein